VKLCECGCGNEPPIYNQTNRARGIIKGEYARFVRGHGGQNKAANNKRLKFSWTPEDHGYETECWTWDWSLTGIRPGVVGYPTVMIDGEKIRVHRAMYEAEHGSMPEGHDIDHLCRNTRCVNPSHMEAVPHAENVRRGVGVKLSLEKAREIRASDEGLEALAIQYGVTFPTIWKIKHNQSWKEAA
jgi:hypothetical protein